MKVIGLMTKHQAKALIFGLVAPSMKVIILIAKETVRVFLYLLMGEKRFNFGKMVSNNDSKVNISPQNSGSESSNAKSILKSFLIYINLYVGAA